MVEYGDTRSAVAVKLAVKLAVRPSLPSAMIRRTQGYPTGRSGPSFDIVVGRALWS